MSFIKTSFEAACRERIPCSVYFLVLWREEQYYGGPEEGGWYGTDMIPEEYSEFTSKEEAEKALDKVQTLAKELTGFSKQNFNEGCLEQCQWCDERGIDIESLPEMDGPTKYQVTLEERAPEASYGPRGYE